MSNYNDNIPEFNDSTVQNGIIYYTIENEVSVDQISKLYNNKWPWFHAASGRHIRDPWEFMVSPNTYLTSFNSSTYSINDSTFFLHSPKININPLSIKQIQEVSVKNCKIRQSSSYIFSYDGIEYFCNSFYISNFNKLTSNIYITDKYVYGDNRQFNLLNSYTNLLNPKEDYLVHEEIMTNVENTKRNYESNKRKYSFKELTDKGYTIDRITVKQYYNNNYVDLDQYAYSYIVDYNNGSCTLSMLNYKNGYNFVSYVEFGSSYPVLYDTENPQGVGQNYEITAKYMNSEPIKIIWNPDIAEPIVNS